MSNNKAQQNFIEAYQKLNAAQQKAVDSIEGPVMVIAGPGTGKTQILSARVGKILLDTDTLPENILCLTYTDAGTIAMRKRLLSFIGSDAYRVNIHTFHSFCNDVIQENLSLIILRVTIYTIPTFCLTYKRKFCKFLIIVLTAILYLVV
jgi:DNA helicase-2/ATP-dependent DNA helicase PcrA